MNLNFVVCPSYHGATLLACLLNNHTHLSALGDTIPKKLSFDKKRTCVCGRSLPTCPFWSGLQDRVRPGQDFYGGHWLPLYPVLSKHETINKMINMGLVLTSIGVGSWIWKLTGRGGHEYGQLYIDFHRAVCDIQGTSQFVDGQKSLVKVLALSGLVGPEINIRVVHLMRDPRGYYCSSKRHHGDEANMRGRATRWRRYHTLARRLPRAIGCEYLLLRYEDLCQHPSGAMRRVFEFLGVENQEVCKPTVGLDKFHIIGNQMRKSFDGTVSLDTSWQDQLSDTEQSRLIKMTEPLSSAMGYYNLTKTET